AWGTGVNPALSDAAAQLCVAVLQARGLTSGSSAFLPWSVDVYRVRAAGAVTSGGVRVIEASADAATFDVALLDTDGRILVELIGWRLRRTATTASPLREIAWESRTVGPEAAPGEARRWLLLSDGADLGERISQRIEARGRDVVSAA